MYYYRLRISTSILTDSYKIMLYKSRRAIRNPRHDVCCDCLTCERINFFEYYWEKLNNLIDRW